MHCIDSTLSISVPSICCAHYLLAPLTPKRRTPRSLAHLSCGPTTLSVAPCSTLGRRHREPRNSNYQIDPLPSALLFTSPFFTLSIRSRTPCSPFTLYIRFSILSRVFSSSGRTSRLNEKSGKSDEDRASSTALLNLAGWAVANVTHIVPGDLRMRKSVEFDEAKICKAASAEARVQPASKR